jgi:hemerythrin-like domain-containing protein
MNRVCERLHDEHMVTIELMNRLAAAVGQFRDPPPPDDPAILRLAADLRAELGGGLSRHFDFEEAELFPYLADAGDRGIGDSLREEHDQIRPLAETILRLIDATGGNGFDTPGWNEFRRVGSALEMTLVPHAQKEEAALLPMLESLMDAEVEAELFERYVMNG